MLCGCYFPELPHLSFLFVLFDLCMNSNKTLTVFPHPCFCLCLSFRHKHVLRHRLCFLQHNSLPPLQSSPWHTTLRPGPSSDEISYLTCSKPFPFTLPPPLLWRPVGPTPGASLLVTGNRLIPKHGPSHSASVTGAFFPVKKREGCVHDSGLERSSTQEPCWTQRALFLNEYLAHSFRHATRSWWTSQWGKYLYFIIIFSMSEGKFESCQY